MPVISIFVCPTRSLIMKSIVSGFVHGLAIVTLFVGLSVVGCGCIDTSKIPPVSPGVAKVCSSDVDCKEGERCWFPGVDTRAICMPGHNETFGSYPGDGR